jgi:uncharacterized protein YprB with RNaseH-like and TPR domain/predicted nuclease with RNAse H fold/dephospho-CoA kinase
MLINTFQHIRGISAAHEAKLWQKKILTWDDFETNLKQPHLFDSSQVSILSKSRSELAKGNANFFSQSLHRSEHFRIALSFPEDTLFLDIETTGLSRYYDSITMIGWSLGLNYDAYIKGNKPTNFLNAVAKAKAIVTYNGTLFDLPFIRQEFPELKLPEIHIDLRFLAKRVNLTGGQKKIEKEIGLERETEIAEMKGENAPILWHQYKQGSLEALKSLVEYNHADIEGLRHIFDVVVERLLGKKNLDTKFYSLHRFSNWKTHVFLADQCQSNGNQGVRLKPYNEKTGPLFTFDKFTKKTQKMRVVGIDLTGSEIRPSGWCLLDANIAYTRKLSSDKEILLKTLENKPDLVSIDSPLSLPEGRLSVSDDDPTRETCGIMRYCERLLKKRGINVYPSLIRSMQKLTERGINLAKKFREYGVPVIESYPGAAQDIMNIPRKGASLEYLKKGLYDFGIVGDFVENDVSHDELDAITSAVVGSFFFSGKFEAIGKPGEGYLIIPDLISKSSAGERKVIGLSGPISAGKTTAAKILESKGFAYGRYSIVLKEILERRGETVTRSALQKIGDEIYHSPGQRWLCERLIERLPQTGNIVIDGMRHPEDHAYMIESFSHNYIHIHVKASELVRQKRYVTKEGGIDEFAKAISHPVESHISKLASLANQTIINEGSVEDLEKALVKIIKIKNTSQEKQ